MGREVSGICSCQGRIGWDNSIWCMLLLFKPSGDISFDSRSFVPPVSVPSREAFLKASVVVMGATYRNTCADTLLSAFW